MEHKIFFREALDPKRGMYRVMAASQCLKCSIMQKAPQQSDKFRHGAFVRGLHGAQCRPSCQNGEGNKQVIYTSTSLTPLMANLGQNIDNINTHLEKDYLQMHAQNVEVILDYGCS